MSMLASIAKSNSVVMTETMSTEDRAKLPNTVKNARRKLQLLSHRVLN